MILAVDFDRVIHDIDNPTPGKRMGPPLHGAVDALDDLHTAGHQIIIHTCKARTETGKQAVEDWLDHYGFEYHDVTALKPNADYFIDDRAIRHIDWTSTFISLGIGLDD